MAGEKFFAHKKVLRNTLQKATAGSGGRQPHEAANQFSAEKPAMTPAPQAATLPFDWETI